MKTPAQLRRQAEEIRKDVVYNTKWGTNFPEYTIIQPLRRAQELEAEAERLLKEEVS